MKKIIPLLFILFACSHGNEINEIEEQKLLKTDEDFNHMGFEVGLKAAFLFYSTDEVILMREGNDPVNGKKELADYFSNLPKDSVRLSWTPVKADVSGDMGYTFGTWVRKYNFIDSTETGTYITIWRKQENGTWRFVLDAGNNGKKGG